MPRNARVLLPIILAAGCASSPPAPGREKTDDHELRQAKTEAEEAARGRREAEARLEDSRRELERTKRELQASRETAAASASEARLSQDLLLQQAKKLDFYKRLLEQGGAKAPDDAAIASAVNPGEPRKGVDPDVPIAIVDGEAVSRREFMEWLLVNEASKWLDPYLDFVLAAREAKRLAIDVTEEEIQQCALEKVAALVKQTGSEDAFAKQLAAQNVSYESVLQVVRYNARSLVLTEKLCRHERTTKEWKDRLEQQARAAFEQSFGERVYAKHFFIRLPENAPEDVVKDALALADRERAQLALGADWGKIASEITSVQAKADAYEYTRAAFAQYPALERLFFDTKDGEISQPLRWEGGISIVKIEKRTPPTARYEERREKILEDLQKKPEIAKQEIEALYARLRAAAKIEKRLDIR